MINTKTDSNEKLKTSKWNAIVGGLFLASFLTICILDKSLWRGVTTAKYFYFTLVMCLVVPLTTYMTICRKLPRPLVRHADISIGLFVIYVIFHRLFMGGGNEMHWWIFLMTIPFYVVMRVHTENSHGIQTLVTTILIVIFIQTLWGVMQLIGLLPSYHHAFPITGSLFNPAPYAGIVAAGIPLIPWHISRGMSVLKRVLGGAVMVTSCIILPFTDSRAAWIAAFAGVFMVVWQKFVVKGRKFHMPFTLRGWRSIVFFLLMLIASIILLYSLYCMKKDSADGRLLIWNVSVSVLKKHPIVGVGTGRFETVYGQAQADYFLCGRGTKRQSILADHPDYAFNECIQIAIELGLIGLFLFFLVIGLCLLSKRTRNPLPKKMSGIVNCRASFIALLVFGLFSYPLSVLPIVILFITLLATLVSQTPPLRWQLSFKGCFVGWAALTLLTLAVAIQVLPRWQSYRQWQETSSLFRSGGYSEALEEYLILYPKLKYEKDFLMEYGRCLSHLGRYVESNLLLSEYFDVGCNPDAYNYMGNNYKAMGKHDKAEQAYSRSSLMTPNRHYPEYLLMKLYFDTGRKNEAIEKAQLIIDKPVKVISPIIKLIRDEASNILECTNHLKE